MQGLRGSAARYIKFLLASTAGYRLQPSSGWAPAASTSGGSEAACLALMRQQQQAAAAGDVQELHLHFLSQCEHHMLPFHGLVHVAYVPGRSGRPLQEAAAQALLKAFSRRLQIQERLTQQLADALYQHSGENPSLYIIAG